MMTVKARISRFFVLLVFSMIFLFIYMKINEILVPNLTAFTYYNGSVVDVARSVFDQSNIMFDDVGYENDDSKSVQQKEKNISSRVQGVGSYDDNNNKNSNSQGKGNSDTEWKKILFWTTWFGGNWGNVFEHMSSDELRIAGCPTWRCHFTTDKNEVKTANAVLFSSTQFNTRTVPKDRTSNQRWVWTSFEAPGNGGGLGSTELHQIMKQNSSSLINWTMSFHPNSDIMNAFGYFVSKREKKIVIRPKLMSFHHLDMERYEEALRKNMTLEDMMGSPWRLLTNRPKLVSWMSSHCKTQSKREDYITELSKYAPVDRYGSCGNITCLPKHPDTRCWEFVLGQQYLFHLSFENKLCDYYATEKLYRALLYNMVPVVWGGKTYDKILPPGSYIDARNYHPKDLAQLLLSLQKDRIAYGRYHLWRGFWEVRLKGSFCELCHKLHTDKEPKHYQDMTTFRRNNTRCLRTPRSLFEDTNNPDAWKEVIKPLK